jgi:hypothetical protein
VTEQIIDDVMRNVQHGPKQEKTILQLWERNLQIRQGEYTLFSANIFVGLRAYIKSSTHP